MINEANFDIKTITGIFYQLLNNFPYSKLLKLDNKLKFPNKTNLKKCFLTIVKIFYIIS